MDLATAERLASAADPQAISALQAHRGNPAVAKAVAEQFGTLLMQRIMQNGDGQALAMAGGTGGNIVNALFANTVAQAAMSGDRLGLADILFRSMEAKQKPAASGTGTGPAAPATPQQPATVFSALPPSGSGFPLSPYWQAHGMRPLAGGSPGTPIEPPGSPVAGLMIRPASPGGAAIAAGGTSSPACPLPAPDAIAPAIGTPPPSGDTTSATGAAPTDPVSESGAGIAAFARRIGPVLQRAAEQLGVSPRILLAQAALESGWGRSVVGNNVFGIKAGPSWQRARISAPTHEVENGRPVAQQASFRAYASLDDAVEDYVSLIADSPRYRAAIGLGEDVRGYGEALVRGGYATDGDYAQKLAAVAASPALAAAMTELNQGGQPIPPTTTG